MSAIIDDFKAVGGPLRKQRLRYPSRLRDFAERLHGDTMVISTHVVSPTKAGIAHTAIDCFLLSYNQRKLAVPVLVLAPVLVGPKGHEFDSKDDMLPRSIFTASESLWH